MQAAFDPGLRLLQIENIIIIISEFEWLLLYYSVQPLWAELRPKRPELLLPPQTSSGGRHSVLRGPYRYLCGRLLQGGNKTRIIARSCLVLSSFCLWEGKVAQSQSLLLFYCPFVYIWKCFSRYWSMETSWAWISTPTQCTLQPPLSLLLTRGRPKPTTTKPASTASALLLAMEACSTAAWSAGLTIQWIPTRWTRLTASPSVCRGHRASRPATCIPVLPSTACPASVWCVAMTRNWKNVSCASGNKVILV